jgi:hypothetical protein
VQELFLMEITQKTPNLQKHKNALRGQNAQSFGLEANGTYGCG